MPKLSDEVRALKQKLLDDQDYRCAICRRHVTDGRQLHLDHDHAVEAVASERSARGVLCGSCNRGLGLFQDSAALLRRAAKYIDQHDNGGQ